MTNYDPKFDSRPSGPPSKINLKELKDILGKAIKDPVQRQKLLADPEKALKDMNYEPHPEAVDFFKGLSAGNFDKAAETFKPHHDDPAFGMAEV
jgi:hypothetical protein